MRMKKVPVGILGTNCYILLPDGGDECVVIDPGAEADTILRETEGRRVAAVLLTHGHFDHIGASAEVAGDSPVYIHPEDAVMLTSADLNGSAQLIGSPVTVRPRTLKQLAEGPMELAGLSIRVLHTPGHSRGGVCYLTEGMLFSGDTLFRHGWGRTDLYGGSEADIMASLRMLMRMRKETPYPIYPGHDDE